MEVKMGLKLTSTAFRDGTRIPDKYTCSGENISPPLSWSRADRSVKSWCLTFEDPGATSGTFVHWLIYNIQPSITSLPEGLPTDEKLDIGALQGKNGEGGTGYFGPCPPVGPVHFYHINLYALDYMPDLPPGASMKEVRDAMQGHIVSQGKLMGVYQSGKSP